MEYCSSSHHPFPYSLGLIPFSLLLLLLFFIRFFTPPPSLSSPLLFSPSLSSTLKRTRRHKKNAHIGICSHGTSSTIAGLQGSHRWTCGPRLLGSVHLNARQC